MRHPHPRRQLVLAFAALGVAAAVVAASVGFAGSPARPGKAERSVPGPTAPGPAGPGRTAPGPTAPDVAAARACAAFSAYLDAAGSGRVPGSVGERLLTAAAALLPAQPRATTTPGPSTTTPGPAFPWALLGEELIAAAGDIVNHDSAALNRDGSAAARQCQTVPAAARAAAGT